MFVYSSQLFLAHLTVLAAGCNADQFVVNEVRGRDRCRPGRLRRRERTRLFFPDAAVDARWH
jgi:hypothetical protein